MVYQMISIVGAALILFAFAAQQVKRIEADSVAYQALNLFGGICLCIAAIAAVQYGFIILEGAWTMLSFAGLLRVRRRVTQSQ